MLRRQTLHFLLLILPQENSLGAFLIAFLALLVARTVYTQARVRTPRSKER